MLDGLPDGLRETLSIVRGKMEIQQAIERMLRDAKSMLMQSIKGREARFLFVVLESMNYLFGSQIISRMKGDYAYLDLDSFRAVLCLKAILDTILERGIVWVQAPSESEFSEILGVLPQHFDVAYCSHLLKIQQIWGSEEALIKQGEIADMKGDEFYTAIKPWVNSASSDPDWMNWYFTHYQEHRNEAYRILRAEFFNGRGLDLDDLTAVSNYLENVCKEHLDRVTTARELRKGWPFLRFKKKDLSSIFAKNMDEARASRWLRELEYRAGQSIYKHPLIQLKEGGKDIVSIPFWIFHPSNWFLGSWISDLMDESRRSPAWGTWSRGYGSAFEKYFDETLNRMVPHTYNLGKRWFTIAEYPEIEPYVRRLGKTDGFEVDRILAKDRIVFVVSCKARDFLFDSKLLSRDLFFPAEEIEQRVQANIKYLIEVHYEAECLTSNPKLSSSLGLKTEKIVPIVVTSRIEPMGVPEVRSYFSRFLRFPDVQMLTVPAFVEFLTQS